MEKSQSELFRIKRASDSKWGYIDKTGKLTIEPQFDSARDFSEGLAWAGKGGKYFFINGVGKIVIDSHEKLRELCDLHGVQHYLRADNSGRERWV